MVSTNRMASTAGNPTGVLTSVSSVVWPVGVGFGVTTLSAVGVGVGSRVDVGLGEEELTVADENTVVCCGSVCGGSVGDARSVGVGEGVTADVGEGVVGVRV